MIGELIAAASVGISLCNAWFCVLVSFGVSSENKNRGVYFIIGRTIGLIVLGLAIAGLGLFLDVPPLYFVITFGVLSVIFGIIVVSQMAGFGKRLSGLLCIKKLLSKGSAPCASNGKSESGHDCSQCEKVSESIDGGNVRKFKNGYVFVLGLARGATPCLKIMVLAPLLVSVDFVVAVAMILVYTFVSTIYPVIGFLSGSLLTSAGKYSKHVKVAAAMTMVFVGVYSIVNVLSTPHPVGGG